MIAKVFLVWKGEILTAAFRFRGKSMNKQSTEEKYDFKRERDYLAIFQMCINAQKW
jgi:hypothetical protein